MNKQKRICVINDISCVGRCSSTVALPILSCAGIHTNILPTAILSTQTGGIDDYIFNDLTNLLIPYINHWKSLGIKFDGVYTGYLGSLEQTDIVIDIINRLDSSFVLVDPVMGDNGQLYSNFSTSHIEKMKLLCEQASIIVPNLTEACFITGNDYNNCDVENVLNGLKQLTKGDIVITGLKQDDQVGCLVYTQSNNYKDYIYRTKIDGMYHGTGDIFASTLLCGILNGWDIMKSTKFATDFIHSAIRNTKESGVDTRQGVEFENILNRITDKFQK